ncbi:Sas10/Utp3/C1D family-domain-containing protein [Lentinula raphanica]|nr:Sas10/Utp3/C1D family-domain-containing protein [Lentinula raphanica]
MNFEALKNSFPSTKSNVELTFLQMAHAETKKAKSRLRVLSSSLDEVETAIAPLFSGKQTLPEILLALEPLEQAKLQTVLPYLLYDLIFIYLRTRGIDPKSHPVVSELERVRQYFEKIKNAENPPVRATQVDKAAANRFIKHAISQAQLDAIEPAPKASSSSASSSSNTVPEPSSSVPVPIKVTSKMLERQEWQKRVDEAGSEEEEDLEGWEDADDDEEERGIVQEMKKPDVKGKGKSKAVDSSEGQLGSKRRRPVIDPFSAGGYDSSTESHPAKKQALLPQPSSIIDPSSNSIAPTPATKVEKNKKQKKKQKSIESKVMNKSNRVAQLLAEVAVSQGVAIGSSGSSAEDDDVDMDDGRSTSMVAGGKTKKRKGKGKRKET